jgi:hypothetical protein
MAANMMTVFWDVALCNLVEIDQVSEVLTAHIIALKMEEANTSETSVNLYVCATWSLAMCLKRKCSYNICI